MVLEGMADTITGRIHTIIMDLPIPTRLIIIQMGPIIIPIRDPLTIGMVLATSMDLAIDTDQVISTTARVEATAGINKSPEIQFGRSANACGRKLYPFADKENHSLSNFLRKSYLTRLAIGFENESGDGEIHAAGLIGREHNFFYS